MLERESWTPSKFVLKDGIWVGSSDPSELSVGSRFIARIQCEVYCRAIGQHAHGRLLDLGCGKVPLYSMYRAIVADVTCIDWKNSLHGSRHVDQFADLNEPLPLQGTQFDTILLTDVLEHILKPDVLFGEMARLLTPGGKLILTVPFLYHVHEEPYDYHRYTSFRLRQFCLDHRLDVLELAPYGGALEVLLDILGKHLRKSRIASRLHLWCAGLLLKTPLLRKLSARTQDAFPLGYCLVAQRPVGDDQAL